MYLAVPALAAASPRVWRQAAQVAVAPTLASHSRVTLRLHSVTDAWAPVSIVHVAVCTAPPITSGNFHMEADYIHFCMVHLILHFHCTGDGFGHPNYFSFYQAHSYSRPHLDFHLLAKLGVRDLFVQQSLYLLYKRLANYSAFE